MVNITFLLVGPVLKGAFFGHVLGSADKEPNICTSDLAVFSFRAFSCAMSSPQNPRLYFLDG